MNMPDMATDPFSEHGEIDEQPNTDKTIPDTLIPDTPQEE